MGSVPMPTEERVEIRTVPVEMKISVEHGDKLLVIKRTQERHGVVEKLGERERNCRTYAEMTTGKDIQKIEVSKIRTT